MSSQVRQSDAVGRPMEILLVEDNLADARLTIEALRDGDVKHRMTLIRDGLEAREFLSREGKFTQAPRPDLILLDVMMPEVDGLSLLRWLREHSEQGSVPIHVVSAKAQPDDRKAAIDAGADGFLAKPFSVEELRDVISQYLSQTSSTSS